MKEQLEIGYEAVGGAFTLQIGATFDGRPLQSHERTQLRVSGLPESLLWEIDAPFFDDPLPAAPLGSTAGLWEFEVVELFISGPAEQYTEIEVGPAGHYLALRLDGVRRVIEEGLQLSVDTAVHGGRWRGRVHIPRAILPQGPHRINAYAIHGQAAERRYLAAFPSGGEQPDFHRLDSFVEVSLP
ncbi:MAG: hypothetical protein CMP23_04765 [Rickettsiales bacterium]|mgnify:CR=1 FL=1|nr:hypothetical protein [Rickettsiales bacterium]|tara:strand:+ start:259 stop:813 length:555 start_codon:yes stop_codon:yes gene_type:complete